jgi:hypothetical protein
MREISFKLRRYRFDEKKKRTLEGNSVKVVKDDLLDLLVDLLLLPEDDVPLPLNRSLLQLGSLQDVRDDLDTLANILLEALGVVDGLLPRGVGVKVSAEVLDLKLELVLTPLAGALESHVLEEVSGSRGLIRLGARTGVDPYSDGSGGSVRVRLGSDGQTVGEGRNLGERGRSGGGKGAEGGGL